MRFRIDLHLSLGKEEPAGEPTPMGDAVGYLADSGPAETGLGFHIPGPRLDPGADDNAQHDNGGTR